MRPENTLPAFEYAIRLGVDHDYHGFFAEELAVREALSFPPFSRLLEVTVSAAEDAAAKRLAESCAEGLRNGLQRSGAGGVTVLGPSQAFIHRLRGEYRWSLTLKGADLDPVLSLLPEGRGVMIDVDPL